MTIEALREVLAQLSTSATALSVLGAELQARAAGKPMHSTIEPHAHEILRQAGALDALADVSPEELQPLIAEIRHFWLIDSDMLASPGRPSGWGYSDSAILQTGGELTEGFANVLPRIAASLDGLAARLEAPDGAFLDVGTGVGRLSIAVARRFPSLRVVGVDVWAPSLALARRNVAEAGLDGRIELREQAGESLDDERAFDLAWIPAPFIPPQALERVVERVRRALRPGGWALLATSKLGDDLRSAVQRLRVAQFGGRPLSQDAAESVLRDQGFVEVRTLPGPPRDFKIVVAGRAS